MRSTARRPRGRGRAGARSASAPQAPVLLDVAPLARAPRPRRRASRVLLPLEPGLEAHDGPVGLVLGEGQVEQVVGLGRRRSGAPGWRPCCRSAGTPSAGAKVRLDGQRGHLLEGHERRPQHDGVADLVDAPPPGPPGELRVLARREELVALAGELR